MENNIFNIQLTKLGRVWLSQFLSKPDPIKITIAIGDGDKPVSDEDTDLHNLKLWADELEVEKIVRDNALHITANFSKKYHSLDFDLKEIGIFIDDEINSKKILLGRYASNNILAKKTKAIDLLTEIILDFKNFSTENLVIDASQYKPKFNNNYASFEQAGTVKFAREEDILNGKEGLALSSELFNAPGILTKRALRDSWNKILETEIKLKPSVKPINTIFLSNKIIYCLFPTQNSDEVFWLKYPINPLETQEEQLFKLENNILFNPSLHIYQADNESLSFLAFREKKAPICKYTLNIKNKDSTYHMMGDSADEYLRGTLNFYTNPISVGGTSKADDEKNKKILTYDLINEDNAKVFHLEKPRILPLVHVIQNQIYCFGGEYNTKGKPCLEIHQISNQNNDYSFSRTVPDFVKIAETEKFISTVLDYKLYFFNKANFFSTKSSFFYTYNYISGNWAEAILPNTFFSNANSENTVVKCVSTDNSIYILFFRQKNVDSLSLTIIEYIPA